ncbi:sensor domain-containing diguanylate cyclase [Desulfoplanes sp.]
MHMPQPRIPHPRTNPKVIIWTIGLGDDEFQAMLDLNIPGVQIQQQTVNGLTDPVQADPSPCLTIMSLTQWASLARQQRKEISESEPNNLVLLLNGSEPAKNYGIEDIIAQHFLDTISLPLTGTKIESCLAKAREITTVYDDIYNMTNEIMLERELLSRKNEQLDFLNKILTKASKSLDPGEIINQAGRDLNILLEVESVMGIFWNNDAPAFMSAEIFVPPNIGERVRDEWIGYLLDQAERHSRYAVKTYQVDLLEKDPTLFKRIDCPEPSTLIQLPLIWDGKTFGVLFVISNQAGLLGRDKVAVLHAVGNHLALALRNALLYRHMQNQADHDGLTRIFNRQNFEKKIVKELKRHQRYQNELGLLMLDLDYFKRINDDYGHLAGDMVLREVSDILRTTIRECDIPARYGGEEFVIILPQTTEEQAWLLAERIRKKIAAHRFKFQEHYFQITTSIGISSIKPSMLKPADYLVHLADQALYRAKTSGRNMVCKSAPAEQGYLCDAASK